MADDRRNAARGYILAHRDPQHESATLYGVRLSEMDRNELMGMIGFLIKNADRARTFKWNNGTAICELK